MSDAEYQTWLVRGGLRVALIVNNKFLKGKGFFRTAFYFPSVTSSIAITTVFLFLFGNSGAVNAFLGLFGIHGPAWFSDPRGLFHLAFGAFGIDNPGWAQADVLGRSLWEWLSGPSVAMMVLIFLGYSGLGISLWPNIIPPSVSIWDAAAPPQSQGFMLVGTQFIIPFILGYTFWSYYVFRGKVTHEDGYH